MERVTSGYAVDMSGSNDTAAVAPYELCWRLAHSGLSPDEAIDAVAYALHVPRAVASGMVWAEMARPEVSVPVERGEVPHWEPRRRD